MKKQFVTMANALLMALPFVAGTGAGARNVHFLITPGSTLANVTVTDVAGRTLFTSR